MRISGLNRIAEQRNKTVKEIVEEALASNGSARSAAKSLGVPYTAIQWWLARNGYTVKISARLVPVNHHPDIEPIHER